MLCWCGCMLLPVSCKKSDSAEAPGPEQTAAKPERNNGMITQGGTMPRGGLEKITREDELDAMSSDELVAYIKFLGDPATMDQRLLMMKAFEKLAARDGIAALNLAKSLPVETCKRVGWSIFGILAKTNPEIVRSWVLSNDWTDEKDRWLSIVGVVEFARLAPGDAATLLKQCDPARSERLRFPILVEIAKSDFGRAMQTAKELGVDKQKDLVAGMLSALGRENPAKAYAECGKLGEPSITEMVVPGILGKWIEKDAATAFGVLAEIEPKLLQMVLAKTDDNGHSYISKLIETDGSLSAGLLARLALTSNNKAIFNQAVTKLSATDFPLAEKLLAGMPDSPAKRELTISAFAALSDRDTENALLAAGKLTDEGRETALRGIAKQLAAKDFEKALAVATGAEPSAQQGIFREVARVAAYQKPDNAVRILEDPVLSQAIGADFRQEMLNATVQNWAKQDLPAAQEWVAKLPPY